MIKKINQVIYLFPDYQEEAFNNFIEEAYEECKITIPEWLNIFRSQNDLDNFLGSKNVRNSN